jgi:hypothetical protein
MPASAPGLEVFLNFPFDARYERMYLALIAGVTALGLNPHCVLEIKTTADRLNRLLTLISECQYSVHDLSRVQLSADRPRCPRFNMPFELGMTIARADKLESDTHWIVLEEKPYRLQKSLSDLNGYDPFVHKGTVTGLLQALLDAFEDPAHSVSMAEMKASYTALRIVAAQLKLENDWPDLYRAAAFRQLVVAANKLPGFASQTAVH